MNRDLKEIMRQTLQILGGEQSKHREHKCKNSEESRLGQYNAKKTSNAGVEDKGEKSRSEGHKGSGIDYGVESKTQLGLGLMQ